MRRSLMSSRSKLTTLLLSLGSCLALLIGWQATMRVIAQSPPPKKICLGPNVTAPTPSASDKSNCTLQPGGLCGIADKTSQACQGTRCSLVVGTACKDTTKDTQCKDINANTSGNFQ